VLSPKLDVRMSAPGKQKAMPVHLGFKIEYAFFFSDQKPSFQGLGIRVNYLVSEIVVQYG
jgi:hypothetical protein